MWTYLAILISISIPIIVFLHKLHVYKVNQNKVVVEKTQEEELKEYEAPQETKVTIEQENTSKMRYKKAVAALDIGDEEEGIKQLIQALAANPTHIKTNDMLAMLYIKKQMYSAASAVLKQLINLEEKPEHYSHLGLVNYQQNLFEEAKSAYQKSIELDPERPQRYVSLAQVYRSLKQPYNAIICANKALEIEEDNVNFLLLLTELFNEVKDSKSAQKTIKRMKQLNEKSATQQQDQEPV